MTKSLEVVEMDRASLDIRVKGREDAGKPVLTVYVDGLSQAVIHFTLTFPEQPGNDEPSQPT